MGIFSSLFGKPKPAQAQAPAPAPKPKVVRTKRPPENIDDLPIHVGEGLFDFEIVGESHYQDILEAMCGGRCEDGHDKMVVAVIRPEPTNRYDKNAIRVEIAGHLVGYFSRDDAEEYLEELEDTDFAGKVTACRGKIVGGRKSAKGDGPFGVILDITMPPDIRIL